MDNLCFSIKNFKSINTDKLMAIKPITIYCGANSIGKSSILQSMLLISQSCKSRFISPKPFFRYREEPIQNFVFEGNICHLQSYNNIIYENNINNKLIFTWNYDLNDKKGSRLAKSIKSKSLKNNTNLQIVCGYNVSKNSPIIENIKLTKTEKTKEEFETQKKLEIILTNEREQKYNLKFHNFEDYTSNIMQGKPYYLRRIGGVIMIDDSDERFKNFEDKLNIIFNQGLENVYIHFLCIFPMSIEISEIKRSQKLEPDYMIIDDIVTDFLQENIRPLLDFYSFLRYLGPLREEPKRFYLFSDLNLLDLGFKGENTTQILMLRKDELISFIKLIKKAKGLKFSEGFKKPLLIGLNEWLEIMNLPKISLTQAADLITKISVNYSDTQPIDSTVALPDVGFGLSQILPVLVETLRMKKSETLILEQPEIHLHPRLQGDLADFILCNAQLGKNFIIETHSEYFIKRLCLRIAQFEEIDLSKLISIYFVVPNEDKKGANIIDVEIDEFGHIKNWPLGFFDDNEDRLILEASVNKKKLMQKNKSI